MARGDGVGGYGPIRLLALFKQITDPLNGLRFLGRSRPIDFGQIVRRRLCQMAIQCKSSFMLRTDTLFLLQFITGIAYNVSLPTVTPLLRQLMRRE